MSLRRMLRSWWFRGPVLLIGLILLSGAALVIHRLGTTHPAMYDPAGVAEAGACLSPPHEVETLVYTSLRPANWDVYLFESPGDAPRQMTTHPNLDYNADLSSDGRWLVFVSERNGDAHIFARDLLSDEPPVALTSGSGMHDAPTLSPDGAWLAFVSTREGSPDIYLMPFAPGDPNAEAAVQNLTDSPYGDFNPIFSPDGSRIAFSSNRGVFRRWNPLRLVPQVEAVTDIYVMDADGGDLRRVARALGMSGSPAWTEDGEALLYHRATGPTNSGIFRSALNGRGAERLTPDTLMAVTPTAGPDGSVIFVAFDAEPPSEDEPAIAPTGGRLYQIAGDGTGPTPLTERGRGYLRPRYDIRTGSLVAHGDGPVPDAARMANGMPFTWPGAVRTVQLPDRCLRLHAMRSYFPSVSHPGDRVVATQWVHESAGSPRGPSALVSAGLDGTRLQEHHPALDDGFMWASVVTRDGESIYFTVGPRFAATDENSDIWRVGTDGNGAVNLTADSEANDAFPDVSADGEWIVFRSGRDAVADGVKEIYLMDRDGERLRRITHANAVSTMPAISPDGEWVVYSSDRAGRGMKLWLQSLTDPGDEGRMLEPGRAHLRGLDMHPRFSPDGQWVVFTSDRGGFSDEWITSGMFPQAYGGLYAVPVDGSGPALRLTRDKWEDGLPFWGPAPGGSP